eukprot:2204285-Rhodomonas_salina.2
MFCSLRLLPAHVTVQGKVTVSIPATSSMVSVIGLSTSPLTVNVCVSQSSLRRREVSIGRAACNRIRGGAGARASCSGAGKSRKQDLLGTASVVADKVKRRWCDKSLLHEHGERGFDIERVAS